jgi:hypothetical protein
LTEPTQEPAKEPLLEGKPGEYLAMFSSPELMEAAIAKAKVSAESDTGLPMKVKSTRQTHYHDKDGRDIYELWATFEPVLPEVVSSTAASQTSG